MLRNAEGIDVFEHEEKAQIIWESFKERLGQSAYTHMYVDLDTLYTPRDDLDWLDSPFTREEIDRIIAELPNNKSPGPDGFNGEFMKKCWSLIAEDFYNLYEAFQEGLCLKSINSSFITLIPKDSPLTLNDFRPISLLNSSLKLLTKLLAERFNK